MFCRLLLSHLLSPLPKTQWYIVSSLHWKWLKFHDIFKWQNRIIKLSNFGDIGALLKSPNMTLSQEGLKTWVEDYLPWTILTSHHLLRHVTQPTAHPLIFTLELTKPLSLVFCVWSQHQKGRSIIIDRLFGDPLQVIKGMISGELKQIMWLMQCLHPLVVVRARYERCSCGKLLIIHIIFTLT